MCEPEAFSALAELMALSHSYGEEVWSNTQWWISGSFAVILTSYFARESLNAPIAVLLGVLYTLFTSVIASNMNLDSLKIEAAAKDIGNLVTATGCSELRIVQPIDVPELFVFPVFLYSMFLSTLLYLAYSFWLNRKARIARDSEVK